MRKVNDEGLDHLKRWEGLRTEAYRDSAGILTIGYGHTAAAGPPAVSPGMTITEAEAETIFRRDLETFERAVERNVKVPLTDNQFAALVSFVYNVGEGAFKKSTLLRKLNAGDYDGVPNELGKWVNAGGQRVQGLANRRAAEAGLWAKGEYVASQNAPAAPKKVNPVTTPEAWGGLGSLIASILASVTQPGPIQWALAFAVVIGAMVAAWFFVRRVRERNP